jgi:hypothetical protein
MPEIRQQRQAEFVSENVGDTKASILIGGRDASVGPVAAQNVNMSWTFGSQRDEFWINVNRPDAEADQGEILADGVLALPSGDIFHFDESGRLKWDIQFDEHPSIYAWTFLITDSGNISYHYQPALTDEEVEAGARRPTEVVGSYAVYGDRRDGEYKTGKLMHIPAPLITDASGDETYGTLDITDGVMTVSIDREWMDNATYPVILDPTFGYTTQGASSAVINVPYRALSTVDSVVATSGATVTAVHAYMFSYDGTPPSVWLGVFDETDGYSRLLQASVPVQGSTPALCTTDGLSVEMTADHTYVMAFGPRNSANMMYDTYGSNASKRITTFADPIVDDYPGALFSTNRWSMYTTYEASATDTVDVDEPEDYTVWQRRSGERSVTLSGTYTGTPTAIEARIVAHGTDTPVSGLDWQTVDAAPSGGTWSGSLTLPAGGWYNVDVRFSNDPGITYTGLNRFGVGDVFIIYGQSQHAQLWTTALTAPTPNALSSLVVTETGTLGLPPANMTISNFLNSVIGETGLPTMVIGAARPNKHVAELSQGQGPYNDLITYATAYDALAMFYNQGTSDVWSGTGYSTYKAALETLLSALATDLAGVLSGPCTFGLSILANTTTDLSDTKIDDIRRAHIDILNADGALVWTGTNQDLELIDGTHHTAAGYARLCERLAQAALKILGISAYDARGPVLSGVQYDTTAKQIVLDYAMNGGTALAVDSGDPAAIEIFGNGVAAAPDSWSVSGTQIVAQYTTLPDLPITLRVAYGYSAAGQYDPWVNTRDNLTAYTTEGLPIPPTSGSVTATEVNSEVIIDLPIVVGLVSSVSVDLEKVVEMEISVSGEAGAEVVLEKVVELPVAASLVATVEINLQTADEVNINRRVVLPATAYRHIIINAKIGD